MADAADVLREMDERYASQPAPRFHDGQPVRVTDVAGVEHDGVARSDIEGTHDGHRKIHDFPVVWVEIDNRGRIPWPAQYVRAVDAPKEQG